MQNWIQNNGFVYICQRLKVVGIGKNLANCGKDCISAKSANFRVGHSLLQVLIQMVAKHMKLYASTAIQSTNKNQEKQYRHKYTMFCVGLSINQDTKKERGGGVIVFGSVFLITIASHYFAIFEIYNIFLFKSNYS